MFVRMCLVRFVSSYYCPRRVAVFRHAPAFSTIFLSRSPGMLRKQVCDTINQIDVILQRLLGGHCGPPYAPATPRRDSSRRDGGKLPIFLKLVDASPDCFFAFPDASPAGGTRHTQGHGVTVLTGPSGRGTVTASDRHGVRALALA